MANTFKLKTKANVGVTTVGIYTAPAATTTVVIGITMANTSGSGVNVGVGITRASDTEDVSYLRMLRFHKDHHLNLCLETKLY